MSWVALPQHVAAVDVEQQATAKLLRVPADLLGGGRELGSRIRCAAAGRLAACLAACLAGASGGAALDVGGPGCPRRHQHQQCGGADHRDHGERERQALRPPPPLASARATAGLEHGSTLTHNGAGVLKAPTTPIMITPNSSARARRSRSRRCAQSRSPFHADCGGEHQSDREYEDPHADQSTGYGGGTCLRFVASARGRRAAPNANPRCKRG